MGLSIERIEILLFIAAIVAILTRRLKLPYSVGLVITGAGLAFLPFNLDISMTKEMIFTVLLPPLIFEAALFLSWQEVRKEFPIVLSMATIGVAIAAVVTAAGMHYFANWPWISAALFGALIAATDPVSVIATFKEAELKGRIRTLVETESLFNDGTAAVMFSALIAIAQGAEISSLNIATNLFFTIGGGVACGALVALVLLYLTGKTEDHLVEMTFTTIVAYGSFLLAEHFHFSGVLATLTAGLVFGNMRSIGNLTNKGRESIEAFWEYAAFVANSLIFLLIGIREVKQNFSGIWMLALLAIGLVMLGRVLAVYPICLLFSKTSLRIKLPDQHILFWGGLRGALALALALGLPDDVPYDGQIVTITFAVVAFSIIIQGITITPFLRYLKVLNS